MIQPGVDPLETEPEIRLAEYGRIGTLMSKPTWWFQYLRPYSIHSNIGLSVPPAPTLLAYTLPVFLLVVVSFVCSFLLVSNERVIDEILTKGEAQATTREEIQRLEHTRLGLETALRNPGLRILFSAKASLTLLRSYIIFLGLLWLTLSSLSGRWHLFLPLWLLSGTSTSVLTLGLLTNTLLKVTLLQQVAAIGPILFFQAPQSHAPLTTLLVQLDAFLFWYFMLLSWRSANLYGERPSAVFAASFLIWLLVVMVFRLLMQAGATLTLN